MTDVILAGIAGPGQGFTNPCHKWAFVSGEPSTKWKKRALAIPPNRHIALDHDDRARVVAGGADMYGNSLTKLVHLGPLEKRANDRMTKRG